MNKTVVWLATLAVSAQIVTADNSQVSWQFPQDADKWSVKRNLNVEKMETAIALRPFKIDGSIGIPKSDIDPAGYNTLRIYYRAEGFKVKRTDGQLYFGTAESPKILGNRRFSLPSLIADGKEQVMLVDLSQQKVYSQWANAGKITQLRLDMADQYPGNVYISKVEFLKREKDPNKLCWDFADGIGEWSIGENLKVGWQNKALYYETVKKDSRVVNRKCRFAGKNFTRIRVVYRAENVPGRTTGQIFFTSDKNKKYDWKFRRVLPALKTDGKTHEFTVKAPWGDENVTSIRLDLVDQHPVKAWIEKIELLP